MYWNKIFMSQYCPSGLFVLIKCCMCQLLDIKYLETVKQKLKAVEMSRINGITKAEKTGSTFV